MYKAPLTLEQNNELAHRLGQILSGKSLTQQGVLDATLSVIDDFERELSKEQNPQEWNRSSELLKQLDAINPSVNQPTLAIVPNPKPTYPLTTNLTKNSGERK